MKRKIFDFDLTQGARNKHQYLIVATSCVSPAPTKGLIRNEPSERLADYSKALAYWIELDEPLLGNILVLENSGFDPDAFGHAIEAKLDKGRAKRSIEIISYTAPPRPEGTHYGYSEFQMFDDLLDLSELYGNSSAFIKTTGRYIYPDISRFLRAIPHEFSFICDAKNIPAIFGRQESRSAIVSMFAADRLFFDNHIRHLYRAMINKPRLTHIEDLIYDEFRGRHGKDGIFLRYSVNCDPCGMGGNGDTLNSPSKKLKSAIRGLCRAFAPFIWL